MHVLDIQKLDELPKRLRTKIQIDGDETTACWLWSGFFVKPRTKFKPAAHDLLRPDRVHGVGMVWCTEVGYSVPAHRAVYSAARGIPYNFVPRLGRCPNHRCVSPHHMLTGGPVSRRSSAPKEAPPPGASPLQVLMLRKPSIDLPRASAAKAAGLAVKAVTDEIWDTYVSWAIMQDDDDD